MDFVDLFFQVCVLGVTLVWGVLGFMHVLGR